MGINKENGIAPKQKVTEVLNRLANPWIRIGQLPPAFSVGELARTTGLSSVKVTEAILERNELVIRSGTQSLAVFIEDRQGARVNGNIELAARASAPSKRSIFESRYQSRKPGGGAVVKAKLLDRNLDKTKTRLGRERLRVKMEPLQEDLEEKRKREIKERQAVRVLNKYGISEKTVFEAKTDQVFEKTTQYSPAVKEDEIRERIKKSQETGEPLILFVPWGTRSIGKPKMEIAVMDRLQNFQKMLEGKGLNAKVLIMAADSYAIEINSQIDVNLVMKYFSFIEGLSQERGFDFRLWSQIRQDNLEEYNKLSRQLTYDQISSIIDVETIQDAIRSSRKRSGKFTQRGIEQAAFAYMRERIIEAELIEVLYSPIKVSAVSKYKDNLDGYLPRVYIFPQEEQFPWLK